MLRHVVFGFLLLPMISASGALAGSRSDEDAVNELSSEAAECAAFYQTALICFEDKWSQEPRAKLDFETGKSTAITMLYMAGKKAQLSDQALLARSELAMKALTRDIDGDCRNISVPILKYGERCKSLIENPAQRLNAIRAGK